MAKNILLVDDDKLVGMTIQRLLKSRGYTVSFVDNGAAAIRKVEELDFNLIISDIRMSKLDGIETIQRIREYLRGQSKDLIPEIFITGFADNQSYKKAQRLGVADFIYKPFDANKFIQIIERILTTPTIPSERRLHYRLELSIPIYLELKNPPPNFSPSLAGQTTDISESGLGVVLKEKLMLPSNVKFHIDSTTSCPPIQAEAEVLWSDSDLFIKEEKTRYGLRFSNLKDATALRELLDRVSLHHIEKFFGFALPEHIKVTCKNNYVFERFDQKQIMGVIDFAPPFLKIQKMAVLSRDRRSILQTKSLGFGIVTPQDTAGHYNETIFLAMCGRLMASAASVFLAILFPTTAPQVVEANGVRPLPLLEEAKGLWKPAPSGTTFFVESTIIKKKLQVVIMRTTISFDDILYGVIEELTLALTPKGSIWSARPFPPSAT